MTQSEFHDARLRCTEMFDGWGEDISQLPCTFRRTCRLRRGPMSGHSRRCRAPRSAASASVPGVSRRSSCASWYERVMKVLLVGGGGREHALARALARDPEVTELHAVPGNPGIGALATLHQGDVLDGTAIAGLAGSLGVDLVVVGPEAPLVAGVADAGPGRRDLAVFGPSRAAAAIEGSKAFAKEVMAAAGIPTAMCRVCDTPDEVGAALDAFGPPYVVKDDALAAGKGVVVTRDRERGTRPCGIVWARCHRGVPRRAGGVAVRRLRRRILDAPMLPARGLQAAARRRPGPEHGRDGSYAPLAWLPSGFVDEVVARVLQPCVDELARRGSPFVGLLYAGLALTRRGVQVVEFNARFGDPDETQPLLELLQTPLAQVLRAAALGRLDRVDVLRWKPAASVTVVMAAAGYPASPRSGDLISGLEAVEGTEAAGGLTIAHAGTANGAESPDGRQGVVSAGGRVLTVTGTGPDGCRGSRACLSRSRRDRLRGRPVAHRHRRPRLTPGRPSPRQSHAGAGQWRGDPDRGRTGGPVRVSRAAGHLVSGEQGGRRTPVVAGGSAGPTRPRGRRTGRCHRGL